MKRTCFRNRTHLLFGLCRLHHNGYDNAANYHRVLRTVAENGAGHAPRAQRLNRDGRHAQGNTQPSLR